MPNWCANLVEMTPADKDSKLEEFIKFLEKYEDDYSRGHVPDGIEPQDSWLFNISCVEEDSFNFESKWAPPIGTMVKIAKMFNFSFTIEYEESGCCIYGRSKYDIKEGIVWTKDIEPNEWVSYDEENDTNQYDVMDKILAGREYVKDGTYE